MNAPQTKATTGASSADAVNHLHATTLKFTIIPALSKEELDELQGYEKVIKTNLKAFFQVGDSLAAIKYNKLYRNEFDTFDEYCRKKWDFTRFSAFRYLRASEVRKMLPIGNILPENEYQVRALAALPNKLVEKAWTQAIVKAGPGKVTGKLVNAVVKNLLPGKKQKKTQKLSWQQDVAPLLKKAATAANRGNRDQVTDLVNRITLLLQVGTLQNAASNFQSDPFSDFSQT